MRIPAILLVTLSLAAPALAAGVLGTLTPTVAAPAALAVVRFEGEPPAALPDVRVLHRFETMDALLVEGTVSTFALLEGFPGVSAVEPDVPLTFDLDTAVLATRVDQARRLQDADGAPLDGRGVGIAVVDMGFDGTHPDLRLAAQYAVTRAGVVASPWTSPDSAHGTHVAGIVAGRGPVYGGVAPGASVIGLGMGGKAGTSTAAVALDWVLAHGHEQVPPIRIVTNSWHCSERGCSAVDGPRIHLDLATALAEAGYVVVFSAGNDGGRGLEQRTTRESTLPTPGIIGVANYDDTGLGVRTSCVAFSSSRGVAEQPATWPDVAAPGSSIMSTWATYAGQDARDPATGRNAYRTLSGTSMATPHVAGIAALLLQANPDLAPGEVEYILKSTAVKLPAQCGVGYLRADPAHPYDGANFVDGHGLVDALAAVQAGAAFAGVPPAPEPESVPASFVPKAGGARDVRKLYLSGDAGMSTTKPTGDVPRLLPFTTRAPVVFTSAPFEATETYTSLEAVMWVGVSGEPLYASVPSRLRVEAWLLPADGEPVLLGEKDRANWWHTPFVPKVREHAIFPATPVTFEPGDRVQLRIHETMRPIPTVNVPQPDAAAVLWWDAEKFPSYLSLGEYVSPPAPDSPERCQSRDYHCSRIDADRQRVTPSCQTGTIMRLFWEGPGGSKATMVCNVATTTCEIPDDVAWGSCQSFGVLVSRHESAMESTCTFELPEGAVPGRGFCEDWSERTFWEPVA